MCSNNHTSEIAPKRYSSSRRNVLLVEQPISIDRNASTCGTLDGVTPPARKLISQVHSANAIISAPQLSSPAC
ncbi:CNT_collapsed_G0025790.mRNA.1.CDS.1 [Saccharomyces cerevisiae]|nr:CNT_collapsed_G0025790.mRNA.1.CDS.1 [Saccharomyces cerevisiae]